MTQHLHHTPAERIGRRLGRAWRALMRLQARCRRALMQAGVSELAANLLIASAWVVVVAGVLHYGLWIALLTALVLFLMSAGLSDLPNSIANEPEWRDGLLGFGLYDAEGFRIDPHDPDRPNR